MSAAPEIGLREEPRPGDVAAVRRVIESSGYFSRAELDVACELVEERLARGPASGYLFVFAERDGELLGYTCYGEIACTVGSYDLYWIAVDERRRGEGLGALLLRATEERIRASRGRRVYIETSGREQYVPTRGFYLKMGYRQEAFFEDFYAPGDGKVVYGKAL